VWPAGSSERACHGSHFGVQRDALADRERTRLRFATRGRYRLREAVVEGARTGELAAGETKLTVGDEARRARCGAQRGKVLDPEDDARPERGTPIGEFDVLIAAHAVALRCTLVSNNVRHFSKVPRLAVET
jgi:predicted nucleic acid-binding protein